MNYIKSLAVIVLFSVCTLTSYAQTTQEEETLSLDSGTINNQFEYLLKKSGNFKGTNGEMYEAVKLNMLLTLKSHVIDSLKTLHKDLTDTQAIVKTQANEIADLKTNLTNTESDLDKTKSEKDSMSLFGLQMSKAGYNILMWIIIAGLLGFLLFFIYKFKNSNIITKDAKQALSEIEEEFEEHRKTALEREQKVRRQLQDEINKQKVTKGNK
ncbi:tRNA (guanine-N1)-methyltransferase [Gaetbulibacter sp. M235]|uniref:tRNA (guanine-N1)-methyltransferase n=1 Tax=Gaetbulibacter sp. M235 TaxID=3126510 RepID=UPI00374EAA03